MNSFKNLPRDTARHGRSGSALAINKVDRKAYILLSVSLVFVALAVMAYRLIPM